MHNLTSNKYIKIKIAYKVAVFTIYYDPLNLKTSLLPIAFKRNFLSFGLKIEGPNKKLLNLVCARNQSVQTYGLKFNPSVVVHKKNNKTNSSLKPVCINLKVSFT